MIYIKNTPNNAGVAIYGDCLDFDVLYDALHAIVGDEEQYTAYEAARIRVLGVCYDLRHALMGDREIEFVDNGMDEGKMKRLSIITHNKNVYLKINVLWPEMLFVMMALNAFVKLHAKKQAKGSYDVMMDKRNIWDVSIAQVRLLQAAAAKCVRDVVSGASFSRMNNLLNHDYLWVDGYATQYLDILNCRFLEMDKEKRLKNIPTMAKRLTEQGDEYREIKNKVLAAATEYKCSVANISIQEMEYPDDIEW